MVKMKLQRKARNVFLGYLMVTLDMLEPLDENMCKCF